MTKQIQACFFVLLVAAGCGSDDTGPGTGTAGQPATATGGTSSTPSGTAGTGTATTAGSGSAGTRAAGSAGTASATAGTGTASGSAGTVASAGKGGAGPATAGGSGGVSAIPTAGAGGGSATAGTGAAGGGPSTGGTLGGPLAYTGPFTMGMTIPVANKCPDMTIVNQTPGDNKSPALAWKGGPADTKSFAVVLYDTRYSMLHWAIWDIPATVNALPESLPSGYELTSPMGAHQAANMGNDKHGYYGPCSGGASAGVYEFRLYALKVDKLGLMESSTATQAQTAIEGMMLEKTAWSGSPM